MTDRLSPHSPSSVWPGQGANGSEMLKRYIVDPVKVKAMNEKYPAPSCLATSFVGKPGSIFME